MSSWGLIVALTGFGYDGRTGLMSFAQATQPSVWFWSTGSAWGTVQQSPDGSSVPSVRLEVLAGEVRTGWPSASTCSRPRRPAC